MTRAVCIVALVFFGMSTVAWVTPCDAACKDGGNDRCPPGCPTCTCSTHVSTTAVRTAPPAISHVVLPRVVAPTIAIPELRGLGLAAPPLRPPIV